MLGTQLVCVDKGFQTNEAVSEVVVRPEDVEIQKKTTEKSKLRVESVVFKGVHYGREWSL